MNERGSSEPDALNAGVGDADAGPLRPPERSRRADGAQRAATIDEPPDGGHVLDRAIDILEAFVRVGPELGVTELSRAVGLTKATTHRLLATLKHRDLVAQDAQTRRYRLGIKLWELGSRATTDLTWLERVRPFLQQLTVETGETSHIAILEDAEILYVDKVESSRSLRMPSQVGRRLPAHCTALGKVLLANLPDEVLAWVLNRRPLSRATPKTLTDPMELRAHLERVRNLGYALDNEELEEGLRCIAAPVRDQAGRVIAAVSTAGPASRLPLDEVARRAAMVRRTTRDMSLALGCPLSLLDVSSERDRGEAAPVLPGVPLAPAPVA